MPKLDGLRGVAIALVLLQHFGPQTFASAIGVGGIGVRIFFVLSGFLITGILIDLRDGTRSKAAATASFYGRRFLRLSPALYLAIIAACVLGVGRMRQDWWAAGLYLYNFLVVARGGFGEAGHLWTLAVEEQFYLLWSLVVLFMPRRALMPWVVGLIVLGPAYRLALCLAGTSNFPQVLLPGNIDGLALGALLALAHPGRDWGLWRVVRSPWTFVVGVAGMVALLMMFGPEDWPRRVGFACFVNLAAVNLVAMGAAREGSPMVDWLSWVALRHLGKISYGAYVFHYFVPEIAKVYFPAVDHLPLWWRGLAYVLASLAASEVSWRLIEVPIRRWRDRTSVATPAATTLA
jgi:peptidoglycan/LPS O-acetylase OafA/YrhL